MTAREVLHRLVDKIPEEKLEHLLEFARDLDDDKEHKEWGAFGLSQLEGAYGTGEPEYTEADIKQEITQ